MSSTKMKSLLKGLRYISQVFESAKEEEEEIQIGNPTDVKHVAHIGWDGPSSNTNTNKPTWMTDFDSGHEGVIAEDDNDDTSSARCMSECGGARSRDLPKLPKSTRKSASEKGSPTKELSSSDHKTKRRSSKKGSSSSRRTKEVSELKDEFSSWPSQSTVETTKKSRRKKKTKEPVNVIGGSTRSTTRRSDVSDLMSDTGSVRSMPQFDHRDDF
ncbi:unnamed protein product [Cochlearia groenlandica]